ncbi:hypothetical protein [Pseudoblastomonas halimionae]|uniref:Lipoprotein n=1 Tax=Alteriqipengyuania halimionae TaxID=1926630 RepID=A0A6I4U1X4_9SPHN|nr:hypothetical protein [Alteriqipengyuania halimionae]MXP10020.1 hypothetical protein [Alteriqipengyuania halimionae]
MKSIKPIRYTILAPLAVLSLAACQQQAAPEPTPPPPPPPPVSTPAPAPAPAPSPTYDDWRDAPQTAGSWYSLKEAGRPANAEFRTPGGDVLVEMRCRDRRIDVRRAGSGTADLPMTFRTFQADGERTTDSRTARPVRPLMYEASLPPVDPLFDRISFSRGRFTLEVPGLPTLYLPSRPEMARVFQECRAAS